MLKLIFTLVLSSLILAGCDREAQANNLKEMDDFAWTAQQAREKNIPIMIMFTAEWCDFCHQLKREVLNPMLLGGLYEDYAVIMRQVSVDSSAPLKFSDTETIAKQDFAKLYNADITPTLIFVDSRGLPVGDRIVGVSDTQLFAAMIHRSINQAYEKMGNPMELPASPEQMRRPLPGFPEK
ncbi:thioredoxin family protein [Thiomicrospira pelophila]|uniref:thioredoxin family protein n=1 Tax=Thiomicrospira pelophila TaxID=934 RepID=UPI0004A6C135|nr:thioredoxin fold domain-containing protein [Thiomicrospira pelophila]